MAIDHHRLGSPVPFRTDEPTPVYVHVPFCAKRCWYCDFNVVTGLGRLTGEYLKALIGDVAGFAKFLQSPRASHSIYIGGGTPSIISGARLRALLEALTAAFPPVPDAEITVEVNPTDATPQLMRALADGGTNRVSIGVQTFDDTRLAELDRLHDGDRAAEAVHLARAAGLASVSIDLLYGLPNQKPDHWEADLVRALALRPDHISAYALTLYGAGADARATTLGGTPAGDALAGYYDLAVARLAAAGYEHYEVSNWALPGHRSRHNLAIWQGSEYLGFGCGAHAVVGRRRYSTLRMPAAYLEARSSGTSVVEWQEDLTDADRLAELIATALRTADGLDLEHLRGAFGYDLVAQREAVCASLQSSGYARLTADRLTLTDPGLFLADGIAAELLPE
ncbi:MAG: radical SAM family heme chaperone HemW [Chloroflexota bacterium]|jgi:oxygen-independent coproporphyrinogen-3 oxidase|nr:radical SAM family heme chaperone HemW [Chloroflexota bacterium]MDP6507937.1 radical SAM family heme chaperone HemW [Chloroflexota bacterium]MDP6757793.1 radical SAM family heme chaperone HemW [Chloroflexota bacterium]